MIDLDDLFTPYDRRRLNYLNNSLSRIQEDIDNGVVEPATAAQLARAANESRKTLEARREQYEQSQRNHVANLAMQDQARQDMVDSVRQLNRAAMFSSRLVPVYDPLTQQTALMYEDARGRWHPVEFRQEARDNQTQVAEARYVSGAGQFGGMRMPPAERPVQEGQEEGRPAAEPADALRGLEGLPPMQDAPGPARVDFPLGMKTHRMTLINGGHQRVVEYWQDEQNQWQGPRLIYDSMTDSPAARPEIGTLTDAELQEIVRRAKYAIPGPPNPRREAARMSLVNQMAAGLLEAKRRQYELREAETRMYAEHQMAFEKKQHELQERERERYEKLLSGIVDQLYRDQAGLRAQFVPDSELPPHLRSDEAIRREAVRRANFAMEEARKWWQQQYGQPGQQPQAVPPQQPPQPPQQDPASQKLRLEELMEQLALPQSRQSRQQQTPQQPQQPRTSQPPWRP